MNNKEFIDSEVELNLPPLYKGSTITFYPGVSNKQKGQGGLRRYVFRYENGKFVYLATRKGQLNGGYDVQNASVYFIYESVNGLTTPLTDRNPFQGMYFYRQTDTLWVENANSKLVYTAGRWEWQTRPATTPPAPPSGPFTLQGYSSNTVNPIARAGTINQIDWYYINKTNSTTYNGTTFIAPQFRYNNNTVKGLNSWPITNNNADIHSNIPNRGWQQTPPEGRPTCITDDILFKCFNGTKLKEYDTCFIEVRWILIRPAWYRWGSNFTNNNYIRSTQESQFEWWVPKPVTLPQQKGRIYRIGVLDADNGIGNVDTVIWAQRNKITTTTASKGGRNALI